MWQGHSPQSCRWSVPCHTRALLRGTGCTPPQSGLKAGAQALGRSGRQARVAPGSLGPQQPHDLPPTSVRSQVGQEPWVEPTGKCTVETHLGLKDLFSVGIQTNRSTELLPMRRPQVGGQDSKCQLCEKGPLLGRAVRLGGISAPRVPMSHTAAYTETENQCTVIEEV